MLNSMNARSRLPNSGLPAASASSIATRNVGASAAHRGGIVPGLRLNIVQQLKKSPAWVDRDL